MDEKNTNENIVENFYLIFDEFLDEGNFEGCKKVIAEVRDLDVLAAKLLESELLALPVTHFQHD